MGRNLVVYQFSRAKVEREDFSHFLGIYGPGRLPKGRQLGEMMNSLVLVIEGYDQDSREIHSIPEVRRFYAALLKAWPYALYFCNLDTDEFRPMVFCCLSSILAVRFDRIRMVKVEYDLIELLRFLRPRFGPMNALCLRAGLSNESTIARARAVFEYFELPFNAGSP